MSLRRFAAIFFLIIALNISLAAQDPTQDASRVKERYTKYEYQIPMRDGAHLYATIYVPKDTSQKYPFLLTRTPYSIAPYGVDNYRTSLGPSEHFEKEGFIFVYEDARGRYMSERDFLQVRPYHPNKKSNKDVDESTDTYDTIEWLLKNIPNNNGRVGMIGISQPGFHVAASLMEAHPALKAASPQAPTTDYYLGDDVYHNGAFMLGANFGFYGFFTPRTGEPAAPKQPLRFDFEPPDAYEFFLKMGPLADANKKYFNGEAAYWQEIVDHPNYDEFWQSRSLWKFMNNVTPAVLNVGGWFDAEDPMGPLRTYRAVEKNNPNTTNLLVMGPWCHGCWARGDGDRLGNLNFNVKTSAFFREQIQFPFFMHYLKDKPAGAHDPKAAEELPEAWMFLTGLNEWRKLDAWPPKGLQPKTLYFHAGGRLSSEVPTGDDRGAFDEYVSDPNKPVPYVSYVADGMTRDYMTEDQRFAASRTDVLVYETAPLDDDLTIAGPINVKLQVSTSGTDSDFVVKLIDVYPDTYPTPQPAVNQPVPANAVRMGGYQQLVRGEPFRAKFRNGFEHAEAPVPMTPNKPTEISYDLPDVYHTFRKGHKIMVQVQSSWFPLVDRNPQKFMDIPKATAADFQRATQRVYRSRSLSSSVTVSVEPRARL